MRLRLIYEDQAKTPEAISASDSDTCDQYYYDQYAEQLHVAIGSKPAIEGTILLESEPQFRTLIGYGNRFAIRIPLPSMLWAINYWKTSDGKYVYPGAYGVGLRVLMQKEPVTSPKDFIYIPPTDKFRQGLVCTPHEMDCHIFDDLMSLTKAVIPMWYNATHQIDFPGKGWSEAISNWSTMSLKEATNFCCNEKNCQTSVLSSALNGARYQDIVYLNTLELPEDIQLIDELWGVKPKIEFKLSCD